MKGKLYIISGPSGVGKNTLLNRVVAHRENLQYSVSATSRAIRPGEVDGKSYYVNKGVLSDPPQKKVSTPSIVTKAVNKVKNTVKKVSSVISSVISGVTAAAKKTNTKPKTVSTPAKKVVKKRSNKILLKK